MSILAKTFWVAYLVLTSVYCVLASMPYTNYALIKAPPYAWIPWFAAHHAHLYWLALLGAGIGYSGGNRKVRLVFLAGWAALGIGLELHPFLLSLQPGEMSLVWAVVALLPVVPLSIMDVFEFWPGETSAELKEWDYRRPTLWALGVAVVGAAASEFRIHVGGNVAAVPAGRTELFGWSVISHVVLALALVSSLNMISRVAARTPRPRLYRNFTVLIAVIAIVWLGTENFLESSFSFTHAAAVVYAGVLTIALVLHGLSVSLALKGSVRWPERAPMRLLCAGALALVMASVVILPGYLAEWDWNGILERTLIICAWCTLALALSLFPTRQRRYSTPAILAVLILTLFSYKGLQATEIFWGKTLGATDYEIGQTMGKYASEDFSFQLTHRLLGNSPFGLRCAELCRILREFTDIPFVRISRPIDLVAKLDPGRGPRPNIFIIVMDSMRPDYLGAYNPKVDFTPNLDAFARDSVVFRHAYSQYSGTTLSEPAIWAGLTLLHSHYPQPFSFLNNLEKLLNTNHYQMVVSYDTVLKQILSSSDDLVKLDTDKDNWRAFDACSTFPQLASELDHRANGQQPVFFYAQPMNVHQYAQNSRPSWRTTSWRRPGFDARISVAVKGADECLGGFFSMLKQRNLYDDSIIIVTSDHGDSTGAFGRAGHALSLYPEMMRVPLLIHVPQLLRGKLEYDESELAALTDITPSIYYLLGYNDLQAGPVYGHSLFAGTRSEVQKHQRHELFIASDVRAAFGILADDGRFFYATYDVPAKGELFDLQQDPNGEHDVATPELERRYDQRVIEYLKLIANFYGYKPGFGSLLTQERLTY